jgi:3-methyladenine DNA glycosylase AlkD
MPIDKTFDAITLLAEITQRLRDLKSHRTAVVRPLRREYSRRIRNADGKSVVRLSLELQKSEVVHRFFGDELIANHKGAMQSLTKADIEKLGRGMDSWDKVDCFGTIIAGPAWRMGLIGDDEIAKWGRSRDKWWRRAALVCTTRLNVAGTGGDAKRTLEICEMLIDDRDDMVAKAMSWALRALAQRDPKSAAAFVERNRSRLAARVLREVGNKLRLGLKNPRSVSKRVS